MAGANDFAPVCSSWDDWPPVLTAPQVAELLQMTEGRVYSLSRGKEPQLPCRRIGRQVRYSRDEIRRWMEGRD